MDKLEIWGSNTRENVWQGIEMLTSIIFGVSFGPWKAIKKDVLLLCVENVGLVI